MIIITIAIDIDDPEKLTDWRRRIEATAPPGYVVTKPHCAGWRRDLENGSVRMQICFTVDSPPDVLPRIDVYGGVCAPAPTPAPSPAPGRPKKRR